MARTGFIVPLTEQSCPSMKAPLGSRDTSAVSERQLRLLYVYAAARAVESVESVLCFPSNCGRPRFLRMSIVAALSIAFFGRQGHQSQ